MITILDRIFAKRFDPFEAWYAIEDMILNETDEGPKPYVAATFRRPEKPLHPTDYCKNFDKTLLRC